MTDMDRYQAVANRFGFRLTETPGELRKLPKEALHIDPSYQRSVSPSKVAKIRAEWSWVACGVIIVAWRDGKYWVIDGGHRVDAALGLANIALLPCLVFETTSNVEEAQEFDRINRFRKLPTSMEQYHAACTGRDSDALFVKDTIERLDIKLMGNTPRSFRAIGLCMRMVSLDREAFVKVMKAGVRIYKKQHIQGPVLRGLWYLQRNKGYLDNDWFCAKLFQKKPDAISDAVRGALQYYQRGGDKICASGLIKLLNTRNNGEHFTLGTGPEDELDDASAKRRPAVTSDEQPGLDCSV